MKIAPTDITPELLHGVLREMLVEVPIPTQKEIGIAVTTSLKSKGCSLMVCDIIEHVVSTIPSCYEGGFCVCQIVAIFAIAFTCGVKLCNAREDVVELEKMGL